MKVATLSLLVVLGYFAVLSSAEDSIWGIKGPNDILLDRKYIKHKGKWFRTTKEFYHFPENGRYNNVPITQISVIDQKPGHQGGYASLRAGGIGDNYVEMEFKSRWNGAFDFIVEIYGQRNF